MGVIVPFPFDISFMSYFIFDKSMVVSLYLSEKEVILAFSLSPSDCLPKQEVSIAPTTAAMKKNLFFIVINAIVLLLYECKGMKKNVLMAEFYFF